VRYVLCPPLYCLFRVYNIVILTLNPFRQRRERQKNRSLYINWRHSVVHTKRDNLNHSRDLKRPTPTCNVLRVKQWAPCNAAADNIFIPKIGSAKKKKTVFDFFQSRLGIISTIATGGACIIVPIQFELWKVWVLHVFTFHRFNIFWHHNNGITLPQINICACGSKRYQKRTF